MPVHFPISFYWGGALALIGAGVIGLSLLSSDASRPPEGRAANNQKTQGIAPVDGSAFRYGPEINHGRSDTPVNAAAQAVREAKATAPSDLPSQGYQRRASQRSGTVTFFNRGLTSGH
jgi:hypothetical protein